MNLLIYKSVIKIFVFDIGWQIESVKLSGHQVIIFNFMVRTTLHLTVVMVLIRILVHIFEAPDLIFVLAHGVTMLFMHIFRIKFP